MVWCGYCCVFVCARGNGILYLYLRGGNLEEDVCKLCVMNWFVFSDVCCVTMCVRCVIFFVGLHKTVYPTRELPTAISY